MDWGRVKFFLGEVVRNFTRNKTMHATAIGTVAVTVALLGAFLFVQAALWGLGSSLLSEIEISVYLKDGATTSQINALRTSLAHDPRVASVLFVPKKQGLHDLRQQTKGEIDMSLLTSNPLPDKIRVRVKNAEAVPSVAKAIRAQPIVANVVYGQVLVQRLLQLGNVMRRIAYGVLAIFLIVAGIIISNTIRLTVFARRREIAIMQLVGATNTYIRLPFICEGLLAGVFGASIAMLVLVLARAVLWPKLLFALPWLQLDAASINTLQLAMQLLLVGGAIGVIASWISVGRYLRA